MRTRTIGALLLTVGLVLGGVSAAAGSADDLSRALATEPPSEVAVSLLFMPLDGSGPRVAHEADRPLPPASVQKLLTSAAALDLLGPDHTFATRILADHPIRAGRIEGDLYLQGEGDPFLVTERLWLLAHEAAMRGLHEVDGVLIVETEVVPALEAIRATEDRERAYAAPVSLLGVNFNALTILVRPGEIVGGPAAVWLDPFPVPRVSIEGGVRTGRPGGRLRIDLDRAQRGAMEVWRVRGTIPIDAEPVRVRRAAREPAMLAGGILAGLLDQHGIHVDGIREGTVPELAETVAEIRSLPLGEMLRSMNAWSNNFMADLLCTTLGDRETGRPGTARIAAWCRNRIGLAEVPAIADGSGLSIQNRVSAAQVVRVLRWASEQEKVFPDLYASLPRPGGEGTLRERFDAELPPAVRAKTGTLANRKVSALAGYVDHPTEGRYAFCILQRARAGSKVAVWELRNREERWLDLFLRP
ncbi:MAG: D-alanyl-D-alanine carboxypeptidase/D-alanyl-D-alanine-endopeptidase [Candidatus Eisenbacteria bacterium]|nr:D-alanyl-D-alanine carboxypeptidase/D-alanyl-D-alanine-endopeptidase [Candidatus Latescibacterota bacterium]MBD3300893.1 D-alanyl-D-alanine carboxypeptidase/D-alanyl-D-alanine-endopeptidase [Candidatus Eisenbacteria bacterium]